MRPSQSHAKKCNRSLTRITHISSDTSAELLNISTSIILRLSHLPNPPLVGLEAVCKRAFALLNSFEAILDSDVTHESLLSDFSSLPVASPHPIRHHTSYNGRAVISPTPGATPRRHALSAWVQSVENLWHVITKNEREGKPENCDSLAVRSLLCRAMIGKDHTVIGEWNRQACVSSTLR